MSYIDNNLLADEYVVYRSRIHWIIFMRPLLWLLICILLYGLLQHFNIAMNSFYKILLAIPLAMAVFDGFMQLITYKSTEFGVTNKRIIVKIGFISRSTSENFLQKVENIQVNQSVLGRILGYGTIIIHGTGGTREPFDLIPAPLRFRKKVQEQVEKVL